MKDQRVSFSLPFSAGCQGAGGNNAAEYIAYFVDDAHELLCPVQQFEARAGETTKVSFTLNAAASALDHCFLVLRSSKDALDEARTILRCRVRIAFQVEFDF